jgi:hypothetical protein
VLLISYVSQNASSLTVAEVLWHLLQETARKNYVDLVSSLSPSSESSGRVDKEPGSESVVITSEDGITKIMLNRPAQKNAITIQVMLSALRVFPDFLFFVCFTQKTVEFQQYSYFL